MAIVKEAGRIFRDPFPLRLKHDCCKKFYICSFFHDLSTRPSSKPIFRGGRLSIYRFHRSCLVGFLPSLKKAWTRCTAISVSNNSRCFQKGWNKMTQTFRIFFQPSCYFPWDLSPNGFVLTAKAVTADARMHPSSPSRTARISLQELSLSLQDFLARHGPIQLSRVDRELMWIDIDKALFGEPRNLSSNLQKEVEFNGGVSCHDSLLGKRE